MKPPETVTIGHCEGNLWRAQALAERLQLSRSPPGPEGDFVLEDSGQGLQLRASAAGLGRPLRIDFDTPRVRRRIQEGRRQPLARAVGLGRAPGCDILDLTGGLGADAYVLAALGCQVLLLERSGPVWALLVDGLARSRDRETAARIRVEHADAIQWLTRMASGPITRVSYLDPMYPEARRSLPRREMRYLRAVVGEDSDSDALLAAALKQTARRVVLKRPRQAPVSAIEHPSFSVPGSSTRFDVYLRSGPDNP